MDTISSPYNVVESKYVSSQQKGYLTYDLSRCAHWQFDIDRASRDVVSFGKNSTLHYLYLNFILFCTLPLEWVFRNTLHEVYFGTLLEIKGECKKIHVDNLVGHLFEVWTCWSRCWIPTIGYYIYGSSWPWKKKWSLFLNPQYVNLTMTFMMVCLLYNITNSKLTSNITNIFSIELDDVSSRINFQEIRSWHVELFNNILVSDYLNECDQNP